MLSVVGKTYVGMLVDKVYKVTDGLIDDEQGDFRSGFRVCRSNLHTKANW